MDNVENRKPWIPYSQVCFDVEDLFNEHGELSFDLDATLWDIFNQEVNQ